MENNQPPAPVQEKSTKPKNSFKLVSVVLAIIVVALAGLSVFLYLHTDNSNQDSLTYKNTSKTSQETNDAVGSSGTSSASSDVADYGPSPYIKSGYFYVPEWSVKFKLDSSLTDYGFSIEPNAIGSSYGSYVVGMTAVQKSDLQEHPQQKYYNDIGTCSMVTVTQTTQDMSNVAGPLKVVKNGEASYVIYGNTDGSCTYNLNNSQIINKLVKVLSSPEKI